MSKRILFFINILQGEIEKLDFEVNTVSERERERERERQRETERDRERQRQRERQTQRKREIERALLRDEFEGQKSHRNVCGFFLLLCLRIVNSFNNATISYETQSTQCSCWRSRDVFYPVGLRDRRLHGLHRMTTSICRPLRQACNV